MPLYWAGLWEAVNIAAGASSRPDGEVHEVGRGQPEVDDVGPGQLAPSANAAASGSDDGRMSRPTRTSAAPVNAANAVPTRRATSSSSWSGQCRGCRRP